MAVEQHKPKVGNLFTDHPRSLGMTWAQHGAGAAKIGFELLAVGVGGRHDADLEGIEDDTGAHRVDTDEVDERLHQNAVVPALRVVPHLLENLVRLDRHRLIAPAGRRCVEAVAGDDATITRALRTLLRDVGNDCAALEQLLAALLPRRARQHASGSVGWQQGPWQAGAELVAAGTRYDNAFAPPGPRLGGYTLLNLRTAYAFAPEWSLSLRVNNVGDKDYAFVRGYNTPGRNVLLAVEYAQR